METFNFGTAIELSKQGKKVARKGWNGKDMFVFYANANLYPVKRNAEGSLVKGTFFNDMVPCEHCLALQTAQNYVATWSPSTSDALAEDWVEVSL